MTMPQDELKAALRNLAEDDPDFFDQLLDARFMRNPAPPNLQDPRLTLGEGSIIRPQAHVDIQGNTTITLGQHCKIQSFAWLRTWGDRGIVMGNHCTLNEYAMIGGHVTLGDGVRIGAHSLIIGTEHNSQRTDIPIHTQGVTYKPITIGSDVYIGSNVIVLNGITIGEGAILAAGAVINRDVPPYTIVGGVPARVVKHRK